MPRGEVAMHRQGTIFLAILLAGAVGSGAAFAGEKKAEKEAPLPGLSDNAKLTPDEMTRVADQANEMIGKAVIPALGPSQTICLKASSSSHPCPRI